MFNEIAYRTAAQINEAMARVYGHMGISVLVSMFVSYFVGSTPFGDTRGTT